MKIDVPIIIKNFSSHNKVKDTLLDILKNQNYSSVKDEYDSITKTDWYVDVGEQREYWKFIYPYLWPVVLDVCKNDLHCPEDVLNDNMLINYWFQQYYKNDSHSWHRHSFCSVSAVYFVELPDNKATEFKLPQSSEIYRAQAKEGDLIFFPSFLIHRSPTNTTNERKTVVAFNLA